MMEPRGDPMAAPTFDIVERDDITPQCPTCRSELPEIYAKRRGAPIFQGRTIMFFCPNCHTVLGMGQERAV